MSQHGIRNCPFNAKVCYAGVLKTFMTYLRHGNTLAKWIRSYGKKIEEKIFKEL